MGRDALAIGANTFQFFPRNPRGSKAKALDSGDWAALRALMAEHAFAPVVSHAPYTMNPCSADPHLRELAGKMMREDLDRMNLLPGNLYNLHPGSHVGQGPEEGIRRIAGTINAAFRPEHGTTLLLETMSGKGTEIGGTFAELAAVLERLDLRDRAGVCIDTCHLFAAGYDIVHRLDAVLEEFDRVIGLEKIRAVHLNDSLCPSGSRKDRHAVIGEGEIGLEPLLRLMTHPSLRALPFITETPLEFGERAEENATLRKACREYEQRH